MGSDDRSITRDRIGSAGRQQGAIDKASGTRRFGISIG
jgi:hypothetical protein